MTTIGASGLCYGESCGPANIELWSQSIQMQRTTVTAEEDNLSFPLGCCFPCRAFESYS